VIVDFSDNMCSVFNLIDVKGSYLIRLNISSHKRPITWITHSSEIALNWFRTSTNFRMLIASWRTVIKLPTLKPKLIANLKTGPPSEKA